MPAPAVLLEVLMVHVWDASKAVPELRGGINSESGLPRGHRPALSQADQYQGTPRALFSMQ